MFISLIKIIRSKLTNFSAHVSYPVSLPTAEGNEAIHHLWRSTATCISGVETSLQMYARHDAQGMATFASSLQVTNRFISAGTNVCFPITSEVGWFVILGWSQPNMTDVPQVDDLMLGELSDCWISSV